MNAIDTSVWAINKTRQFCKKPLGSARRRPHRRLARRRHRLVVRGYTAGSSCAVRGGLDWATAAGIQFSILHFPVAERAKSSCSGQIPQSCSGGREGEGMGTEQQSAAVARKVLAAAAARERKNAASLVTLASPPTQGAPAACPTAACPTTPTRQPDSDRHLLQARASLRGIFSVLQVVDLLRQYNFCGVIICSGHEHDDGHAVHRVFLIFHVVFCQHPGVGPLIYKVMPFLPSFD
ncbi:hypothetical protein PVAP13_4KG125100 [Panicum virgatum]|uniref:Uncharacterized protein n=1 Tax=Panicum virgatum TaxID=38727 RepID=A0A8T0TQ39_PANVG|nr:hypothetical protein PVAP13_4KG125100 [Panicum virgatum]